MRIEPKEIFKLKPGHSVEFFEKVLQEPNALCGESPYCTSDGAIWWHVKFERL